MKSFKIRSGGKLLDYRQGEKLNLNEIKSFFQSSYEVKKIWNGNRHVLGILAKNNVDYFLKLSTSEGISIVTKNEYYWNDYFNNHFSGTDYCVPKNYDSGLYRDKYFYLITDYFEGEFLCNIGQTYEQSNILAKYTPFVIELFELIQKMPVATTTGLKLTDYGTRFIDKTNLWFKDIPTDIRKRFKVQSLLDIVEKGAGELQARPRHGDFTPWHIIKLQDRKIGLIDGEHFLASGVEGYDICYFIQRVFSVLKNPGVAQSIYLQIVKKGYSQDKLKTVLSARAIGGFLDESLKKKPDFKFANSFKDWVIGY